MAHGAFEVAKKYITCRYTRSLVRQSNTADDRSLSLIGVQHTGRSSRRTPTRTPTINAVQRDYMADAGSPKDITRRICCCRAGIVRGARGRSRSTSTTRISYAQHLCTTATWSARGHAAENGTVISGTLIDSRDSLLDGPQHRHADHRASSPRGQYAGGQSISLTHLAPFVDVSRKKITPLGGKGGRDARRPRLGG